jgi:hypothetical protein
MMDKKDNVKQTTYGYEITWVSEETYGGKILVFDKIKKQIFGLIVKPKNVGL